MTLNPDAVKTRCEELGIKVADIPKLTGINRNTFYTFMSRHKICPLKKIKAIADILDVDYTEIVEFTTF